MTTVLVVDDEAAVRENLAAYLEDEGMRVFESESGELAVQRVRDGLACEVSIMDMRLPGMDGNATILALHKLDRAMKFLVHTGSVNYALPAELRALGMTDTEVFRKPLEDMGVLAEAVRQVGKQ